MKINYKLDNLSGTAEIGTDKYMVQTRSQTKSSGIKVPEVPWCRQRFDSACQVRTSEISGDATYTSNEAYKSNTAYRQRTTYRYCTTHDQT